MVFVDFFRKKGEICFEKIINRSISLMIDKSRLNKQALKVFEELIKAQPGWKSLTTNFQFTYGPDDKPHTISDGFKISILCPFAGNPPIEIEVDEIDSVCVKFGLPFEEFDMHYPYYEKPKLLQIWISLQEAHIETTIEGRSANYIAKKIIECVEDLMKEKLISAEWKTKKKSSWQCGLVYIDYYQELENRVYFLRSVSWNGTYNRSFEGKWEWGT